MCKPPLYCPVLPCPAPCRPTDPEPLKRLKMEMRVALKEEDYGAAARIRDHPFMRMHLRILDHIKVRYPG